MSFVLMSVETNGKSTPMAQICLWEIILIIFIYLILCDWKINSSVRVI